MVVKSDATPPGSNLILALAFRGRCPRLLHIALSGRHGAGLTVAGTSGVSAQFNAYGGEGVLSAGERQVGRKESWVG